jgi:hypothetical protein
MEMADQNVAWKTLELHCDDVDELTEEIQVESSRGWYAFRACGIKTRL